MALLTFNSKEDMTDRELLYIYASTKARRARQGSCC